MTTQEKTLASCTLKYLDKTFKLREISNLPALNDWLTRPAELSDFERQALLRFQAVLTFNVHDWNEQELSLNFIGPVFALINFSTPEFNFYAQRDVSGVVEDTLLYGRVDGMVASGRREPEIPFFAFERSDVSEYKRNLDPNGDPAGQVLAAMLVGQALNRDVTQTESAMYGCYVVGRDWYFMALDGRNYATTKGHNALDTEELFDIFRILKVLRQLVAERISPVSA